MNRCLIVAAVVAASTATAALAANPVLPYTENFTTGNANWTNGANSPITYVSSGGPAGTADGYISSIVTDLPAATGTAFSIFARATGSAGASGGAFSGSYAGIYKIDLFVRENYAASPLTLGIRLGGVTPGTALSFIFPTAVQPNVWTELTAFLYPDNPNIISYEGTPGATTAAKFANATSNVANLQVFDFGTSPPGAVTAANVTFDVDAVTVTVPEPVNLLPVVGLALLARRRRA